MYKRILAPIDGSPTSMRGLMEAVKLAKNQKAKLRLLHVVPEAYLMLDAGSLIVEAKMAATGQGVEVEGAVVENMDQSVGDKILSEAREWQADIIVMGTHGRRGFSHLVLGSDAEAVVHGATVPVLLVKAASVG
jgi:nucleotide-binding universal stress UspA family protein